ncbi:MAG: hypothetical protein KF699_03910 [Phycisphaeraceae bacterium]|nr:hypothetical protein [Phycisphaeraceae bacterium]MBX3405655.1 hypothetical protein [Phycisphaeraceae bacterium]
MHRAHRAIPFVLALSAAPWLACCTDGNASRGEGALQGFGPERLSVHPLTRFSTDAAGQPVIVCHFELRDRYGQLVRALGLVQCELFRPGSEQPDGTQLQDLVWRIDLTKPEENARQFDDLVTRTYTLSLGGLPEWLLRWRADEDAAGTVSPTLRVTFYPGVHGDGPPREDVLRLSR